MKTNRKGVITPVRRLMSSLHEVRIIICLAVLTSVALPAFSEEFWVDDMRYSTDGNTATLLPKTDKVFWSSYEDDHYSFMEVEVPESVTYNGNQIPVQLLVEELSVGV